MLGDLNKRIEIQAQTKVSDGMGGFTVTWQSVAASVPAAIWPVSAKEQLQAMGQTMTITHRVRIRYRSILRASWRIAWAGRYFNIISIVDVNMAHRWMDLLCREAANG